MYKAFIKTKNEELAGKAFVIFFMALGSNIAFAAYKLVYKPEPWWKYFVSSGKPVLQIVVSLLIIKFLYPAYKAYCDNNKPSRTKLIDALKKKDQKTAKEANTDRNISLINISLKNIRLLLWASSKSIYISSITYMMSLMSILPVPFVSNEDIRFSLRICGDFFILISLLFFLVSLIEATQFSSEN